MRNGRFGKIWGHHTYLPTEQSAAWTLGTSPRASITAGNKGVGRLTGLASQNGSIAYTYDARGNITRERRTIGGQVHDVDYAYNAADAVTEIIYPSGRRVTYTRDTTGRITGVTTKQTAASAPVDVATSIVRQPISNIVKSLIAGNGLSEANTHTLDYEHSVCTVSDGVTPVISKSYARADALNLTGITDNIAGPQSQSFAYSPANRMTSATGPFGALTYTYDGVGNRTGETFTPPGGGATARVLNYPAASNKLSSVTIGAATDRSFTYDGAGNTLGDTRAATLYAATYNKRNRLETMTVGGSLKGTYTYNGLEQLSIRVLSNMVPAGTTHFIHDQWGNVIAETAGGGASGPTGTVRECIWLPEAEIAPTMGSRAQVDRPLGVVDGVNATPVLYFVHADHLNRPVRMTNAAKNSVWDASWWPFGAGLTITGPAALDARFPGQWFQLESSLHYNWHRHYDPSLGRYTQPDPLGFVDGPSVYGYVRAQPQSLTDFEGLMSSPTRARARRTATRTTRATGSTRCRSRAWCRRPIRITRWSSSPSAPRSPAARRRRITSTTGLGT